MGKQVKDELGNRMKRYEAVTGDRILVPKMPFIIRVDGKAFHTFTKGVVKPFDKIIEHAMIKTAEALCKDIPGAVIAYTQSDEITVVCKYVDRIKSEAWFNGRISKIETISASKATKYFNKFFYEAVEKCENRKVYERKLFNAEFDSRVFNIPEWDCINNIIWRQQDAIRNSVESVGHCHFTAKQLNKVCNEEIKNMLLEKGISWEDDFTSYQKYGCLLYKATEHRESVIKGKKVTVERTIWQNTAFTKIIVKEERDWFSKITGLIEY